MTQTERNFRYRHKRKKLEAYRTILALKDLAHTDPKVAVLLERALKDYERHKLAYETGMRGLTRRGATPAERMGMADMDNDLMHQQDPDEIDWNDMARPDAIQSFTPPELTPERRARMDRLGEVQAQHSREYTESITETPEERRKRLRAEAQAADDKIIYLAHTRSLGKKDDQS